MRSGHPAVLVVTLLATAAPAAAQRLQPRIAQLSAVARPTGTPRAAQREPIAARRRHSLLGTVLYGAGGAVLGGWAGYMTSQIVWSDWQELSRPGVNRLHYTLTGAGIGAVAGALLGYHVGGAAPAPVPPGRRRSPWGDLPVISAEEVHAAKARTAAELILELRPGWIERRTTETFGGAAVQTITPEGVAVFLDGRPIGNLADLTNVSVHEVDSVEYYDVRAAALRWGTGELRRVINVITDKSQG